MAQWPGQGLLGIVLMELQGVSVAQEKTEVRMVKETTKISDVEARNQTKAARRGAIAIHRYCFKRRNKALHGCNTGEPN